MKKILRLLAIAVLALSLGTAGASAATGDIFNTGPDSYNKIEFENRHDVDVNNRTRANINNNNPQYAETGEAKVNHNTTGGDATSGEATNDSLLRVAGSVDNTASSLAALEGASNGDDSASIEQTGPDSYNKVEFENKTYVDVNNKTSLNVNNNNPQTAVSGDARVEDNTTGGDATSGDACNISTVDVSFEVNN
jgi:hypothetical protein